MSERPEGQRTLDAPQPEERHLRSVVDLESGELTQTPCAGCESRDMEIAKLRTEGRSWHAKFTAAIADKEAKARKHRQWPQALELFGLWQKLCNHEGVEWTADHFWQIEPRLRDKSLGYPMCRQAVKGAGYDAFVNPKARRNGSHKIHDGWELIFRDPDHVRDFAARAPLAWDALNVTVPPEERLPGHYIAAELADA